MNMAIKHSPTEPNPAGNPQDAYREIPFNYTSADDRQAVSLLLGPAIVKTLDELRSKRVTGRSARLLMRFFGEILIHRRNPYLFQELIDSDNRRKRIDERQEPCLRCASTDVWG